MASDISATVGRIPTLHVVADSIPQAHYRAMKAVWEQGLEIRTEYDRKSSSGEQIDPPSRDARVLVEVTDPFSEPRYPAVSFCEIGTYIAEIMGAKDHYVLDIETLKAAREDELSAHEWPYTYHQRMFAHPGLDGSIVDQVDLAVKRVARTPYTRRAVATTAEPNVDVFLDADVPCLREVQLRCPEDADGNLKLNASTYWRSRDLFKAWADNVVGLTFLFRLQADKVAAASGRTVTLGSYADYSSSLHIYGQDHGQVGGDTERGLKSFFDTFDEQAYLDRSLTSADARDLLVLPQMRELLSERMIEQWRFPQSSIDLITDLIAGIESGKYAV